jgi:hypothetical protein
VTWPVAMHNLHIPNNFFTKRVLASVANFQKEIGICLSVEQLTVNKQEGMGRNLERGI